MLAISPESLYGGYMDAFEPFFRDDKYKEIISKFSELESKHLDYVSVKITPADLSKIIIPNLVKEYAISMCADEVTIINMILRSFVVEQNEGITVNFKKFLNLIKTFDGLTDEQKYNLIKHITSNY